MPPDFATKYANDLIPTKYETLGSFTVTMLDSALQPGELPPEINEHYFDDVPTAK